MDEAVRRVIQRWSQEQRSEAGPINLARSMKRLNMKQRRELIERMAEIALGTLWATLHMQSKKANEGIESIP